MVKVFSLEAHYTLYHGVQANLKKMVAFGTFLVLFGVN